MRQSHSPRAQASIQSGPRLPIRLRSVLLAFLVVGATSWTVPRLRAFWELQSRAVGVANYALCVVGPTGPELLRQGSPEFQELLRRRIVLSSPEAKPFEACVEQAVAVGLERHALLSAAADYQEYFEDPERPRTRADLLVDLAQVFALAERAAPFVQGDSRGLVQPQSHAREASHPRSLPAPSRGHGLPRVLGAFRHGQAFGDFLTLSVGTGANARSFASGDRGRTWHPQRGARSTHSGSCSDGDPERSFSLTVTESRERVVVSYGPMAPPHVARLGSIEEEVLSVDCDGEGLLALLETRTRELVVRSCAFRGPCRDVLVPPMGPVALQGRVDVARVGGDIAISMVTGRLTRVTTSRGGEGQFTPWTLVFDGNELGVSAKTTPDRFLHVGDDLFLLGQSSAVRESDRSDIRDEYFVLLSRDHGASFGPIPGADTL